MVLKCEYKVLDEVYKLEFRIEMNLVNSKYVFEKCVWNSINMYTKIS